MANAMVQVRRAYEDPAQGDGTRVLAGRIWPRGLTKARAALDEVSAFEKQAQPELMASQPPAGACMGPVPGKRSQLEVQLPSLTGRPEMLRCCIYQHRDARRFLTASPAACRRETRFPNGHRGAGAANAFSSC